METLILGEKTVPYAVIPDNDPESSICVFYKCDAFSPLSDCV